MSKTAELIRLDDEEHGEANGFRTLNEGVNNRLMKNTKPKDVDAYLATAPKEVRGKLEELRSIIRKTAPAAVERISYGMPYYHYQGRLAYFSFWKAHIGLYLPTPTIAEHQHELAAYETNKATVRFPLEKKLPVALIRKLIKSRMIRNEGAKGNSRVVRTSPRKSSARTGSST